MPGSVVRAGRGRRSLAAVDAGAGTEPPKDLSLGADDALDVEGLRPRVEKHLEDFLAAQTPGLEAISDDLAPVVDAMSSFLSGGKRLRPAFCYWGWRGAGGADGEGIVRAAAALGFFQSAPLIHHHLMDDSDTPPGAPALHRRVAPPPPGGRWAGGGGPLGAARA